MGWKAHSMTPLLLSMQPLASEFWSPSSDCSIRPSILWLYRSRFTFEKSGSSGPNTLKSPWFKHGLEAMRPLASEFLAPMIQLPHSFFYRSIFEKLGFYSASPSLKHGLEAAFMTFHAVCAASCIGILVPIIRLLHSFFYLVALHPSLENQDSTLYHLRSSMGWRSHLRPFMLFMQPLALEFWSL